MSVHVPILVPVAVPVVISIPVPIAVPEVLIPTICDVIVLDNALGYIGSQKTVISWKN